MDHDAISGGFAALHWRGREKEERNGKGERREETVYGELVGYWRLSREEIIVFWDVNMRDKRHHTRHLGQWLS